MDYLLPILWAIKTESSHFSQVFFFLTQRILPWEVLFSEGFIIYFYI